MAKITNNSNGPRNIHTSAGVVTLQPGESLPDDAKVSADDMKAMKDAGLLDAPEDGDVRAGTGSIADVQREIASAAGDTVPDDMKPAKDEAPKRGRAAADDKAEG